MDTLTDDERSLISWARDMAHLGRLNAASRPEAASWRFCSVAELLLAQGRLFTPRATPQAERAELGKCFQNATERAEVDNAVVYVEGLAVREGTLGTSFEHGWCAAVPATAVDPTWPDGTAYLGVPLVDDWRLARQQRSGYWSLLWSAEVRELLEHGIPDAAVADLGRPLPDLGDLG